MVFDNDARGLVRTLSHVGDGPRTVSEQIPK